MGIDDLGLIHQATVFGDFPFVGEDEVDLFDVLGRSLFWALPSAYSRSALMKSTLSFRDSGLFLLATITQAGMPVP